MACIAVIPARAGSKSLPGKNKRSFVGKPLIYWSIQAALACPDIDEVIVSTDCPEIQAVAVRSGAKAPALRPAELATDTARCIDAVHHAVKSWVGDCSAVATVVILQPTSPMRTTQDISNALAIHRQRAHAVDAVVSVTSAATHPLKMYTEVDGCLQPFVHEGHIRPHTTNRQELPCVVQENGAIYAFDWQRHLTLRDANNARLLCGLHAARVTPYIMPPTVSHDIDTEEDWVAAEKAHTPHAFPKSPSFSLGGRIIGANYPPLVIAEIGINHEGDMAKAIQMVKDAKAAGAECVKFQSHICEDEMTRAAGGVIPGNADVSILEIMQRCALTREQDIELKALTEELGMIYLSSPFSRAAADHLESLGVPGFKIGSGECNNTPLIKHIASFGKPVILSTGMNDIDNVRAAVDIFEEASTPYALLHVTSMYPTPYDKVRLGCVDQLRAAFPGAVVGLSDHSLGNWTCFGAVALGASILEKHFTSDKEWPGPDVPISIDPPELADLVRGSRAVWEARGGTKTMLPEEQVTADFAFACVVTIAPVKKGETFTKDNVWVKRPGTGELLAVEYDNVLGKQCTDDLEVDVPVKKAHVAF